MSRLRRALLPILLGAYALGLGVWFLLRQRYGDGLEWLALANTFALYLFLPLIFFVVWLLLARRYWLLFLWVAPLALFLFLFGAQFVPSTARAASNQPTLRVMTFNVNGNTARPELATTQIAADAPDIILIQELSRHHAYDITSRLGTRYPFHQIEPIPGRRGIGIFSRFPLQDAESVKLGKDQNAALRARVEWQGRSILLVNTHLASTMLGENISVSFRERETQVTQLLTLVKQENVPAIVAGDFNLTDTTQAYTMLARDLNDAHREASWGLGFTFPASPDLPRNVFALLGRRAGMSRDAASAITNLLPLPAPPLLRIDYIFSTNELSATNAYTAAWDGQSDHRAVIAEYQFNTFSGGQ